MEPERENEREREKERETEREGEREESNKRMGKELNIYKYIVIKCCTSRGFLTTYFIISTD